MATKTKKPQRDPNVPVLKWKNGDYEFHILIAGPKDIIRCACNPKYNWTPNSVIIREYGPNGLKETENELHSPSVWGWIGRLMVDKSVGNIELLTATDSERFNTEHGLVK